MLKAGSASVDITPNAGTHLAGSGMGNHRPAEVVLDRLFARAAVFAIGEKRVGILTLDTLAITGDYTARIREAAAARFGITADALIVHSLQNHSAPSCGALMLDPDYPLSFTPEEEYIGGSESDYCELVVERSLEAINQAMATLKPVELATGRAVRSGLAFNRRGIRRDGGITMPFPFNSKDLPLGPTHISHMEGPDDPEVGVLCTRTSEMDLPVMLLHFTCHPVNTFVTDSLAVSGDWPGAFSAAVEKRWQTPAPPLVLNGSCGNINPWPAFTPDWRPDHQRMGTALAESAGAVIRQLRFQSTDQLDWRCSTVELNFRDVPPERQAEVDAILDGDTGIPRQEDGEVDANWFLAASTQSIAYARKRSDTFPYEIQVFRIGDAAIVSWPGEPFIEGQLLLKEKSPAALTIVAHMTSHYVGYVATAEAWNRDGHETNSDATYWAKLAPDSLDRIVSRTLELLNELFPNMETE